MLYLMPAAPERPFAELSPFEQRLRVLAERARRPIAQLVDGLSPDTLNKLRRQSAVNGKPPPIGKAIQELSKQHDVPIDWIVEQTPIKADAPIPSASERKSVWREEYERMGADIAARMHLGPPGVRNPPASERTYTPARQEEREARLSNVRRALLKKYPQPDVDAAIGGSEFLDGLNCSELEAYQRLEGIIQLIRAAANGKLISAPQPPHPKEPPRVGPATRERKSSRTSLGADDIKLAEKRAESMRDTGRGLDRAKKKGD
jgi:hypothetical protein